MQLGEQPDPGADRARDLLRQARAWSRRRGPRILLICFVLLAAVFVGVVVGMSIASLAGAAADPDATVSDIGPVVELIRAAGLDPMDTLLVLSGIKNVNVGLPAHVVQGALSKPERIELDIKELDYQRLAYEREVALSQGMWLPTDADYVPVTLRYRNQTLEGRARLKGDWPDHWYSEKWSLRFKLNGSDRLDHMREFALQGPKTRNYMAEWLFQQALAREGVSGLRYGFVDVTINGKPMGTYAIEEAFDDGICAYNNEVPGPLLRFTDTAFWESRAAGLQMVDPYHEVPLDVFGGNATEEGYSEADTAAALNLLERWRNGEIQASDAFDVNRTARYFAISDLHGNVHGNIFHNIRFYYNPISARLEPVGHDANAGGAISTILGASSDPQYRRFFDDPVLFERYIAELDRVAAPGYLEDYFADLEPAIAANVSIIYRDQPFYFINRAAYFENRQTIRALLHPYSIVSAYLENTTPGGVALEIGSSQLVPVEVTAVTVDGVRALPIGGAVRLAGKMPKETVAFRTVAFALPPGTTLNASAPVEVECRLVGTTEVRQEPVTPRQRLPDAGTSSALARSPPNPERFEFALVDAANRTVVLLPGTHTLAESLITPAGYTVRCGPGTTLDLVQNASIVANGPLEWVGTETEPVTVRSSDGTGGGVRVLRAPSASTLGDVRFENVSAPRDDPLPGAGLIFLESQAELYRVSMTGTGTAPLLRLVDCRPFNVTASAFAGASGPAVSVESSRGTFSDFFVRDGAGLETMESQVTLQRARFEGIAGTAVLAERQSTLYCEDITCAAVGTAVVADHGAALTVHGLTVRDSDAVARAGRGGTGFGPGRVELTGVDAANVTAPYGAEGGGAISVDGRSVGA